MSKRSKTDDKAAQCVCGSGQPTHLCCLPYIEDASRNAPSAQALMRSRYTAYTLQHVEYLLRTWHPDTRPEHLTLDADIRWLGLKLKRTRCRATRRPRGTRGVHRTFQDRARVPIAFMKTAALYSQTTAGCMSMVKSSTSQPCDPATSAIQGTR